MSLKNIMRRPQFSTAGAEHGFAARGRYVLVISGSPVNRVVVCRILQDCGIRPVAVDIGAALELLQVSPPQLIIVEAARGPATLQPLFDKLSELSLACGAPPVIYLARNDGSAPPEYPFNEIAKMPVALENFRPLVENYLRTQSP